MLRSNLLGYGTLLFDDVLPSLSADRGVLFLAITYLADQNCGLNSNEDTADICATDVGGICRETAES